LLMEHFWRWGLEVHAGSYSPHKESKTEIQFCARPYWTHQDKETFDDTNLDDITLPRGRFIPVISEFRYLGSYFTRDGTDTKDIRARINSAARAFGALSKCIFNRHTSNVMPNELCMKDWSCPYVSTDARAGASKKLFIKSCANFTLAVWEQWAERIYTTPGSIASQLNIWRSWV
jgi:hypothetical protein